MKTFKRLTAAVLALIMCISLTACSSAGVEDDGTQTAIVNGINSAGKYLTSKIKNSDIGYEYGIIALNRSTYIDYWHTISETYDEKAANTIRLNAYKMWEKDPAYAAYYDEMIVCHTTIGILADFSSKGDLTEALSYEKILALSAPIHRVQSLIAIEGGDYNMYPDGDVSKQDLIDFTMGLAHKDGSFRYDNMGDVSVIKATATAVTALALTDNAKTDREMARTIERGVNYLIDNIKETDSIDDIASAIIALNTTGHTSTAVAGKDLTQWLLSYRKKDGSFANDKTSKKGNVDDTSMALMGLASQYRFNTGMTSIYDLSDVKGGAHNKLSPAWQMNVRMMLSFIIMMVCFLIYMAVLGAYRERKWKKEGIWDYEHNCRYSDEEIERIKKAQAGEGEETPDENVAGGVVGTGDVSADNNDTSTEE